MEKKIARMKELLEIMKRKSRPTIWMTTPSSLTGSGTPSSMS